MIVFYGVAMHIYAMQRANFALHFIRAAPAGAAVCGRRARRRQFLFMLEGTTFSVSASKMYAALWGTTKSNSSPILGAS